MKREVYSKREYTLVGISELRTNFNKVLEAIYNQMEEFLELIEDIGLGYLAKERDLKSKPTHYIDLDSAEKKIKTKK